MEPRNLSYLYMLQWGRSVNAAETPHPCVTATNPRWLQWGRSVNAAETGRDADQTVLGERGFNGAAALTLRKLAWAAYSLVQKWMLQWGRSVNAAETVCSISFVDPTSSGYVFERIAGPGRIA